MIYGYARVSTATQTSDPQVLELKAAGAEQVRCEVASGALESRPVLDQLLAEVAAGDTVMVVRLDRLGRSLPHLVSTVDELARRGVEFRSLREAVDTTTATGKLMLGIFAALADFERELIRERIMAGLESARAQGRLGGRPRALSPDQHQAALDLLAAGTSIRKTAKILGVSRPTIYREMQR